MATRVTTLAVFMEEEVFNGTHRPPEHWFSPISNAFAWLHPRWLYARGLEDVIGKLEELKSRDLKLRRLRIHSHGYNWGIRMGSDDLRPSDLGNTIAPNTERFLALLKQLLSSNDARIPELRFDACGQASNQLLQSISVYLGEGVIVRGFSRVGNPVTRGDLAFRGGQKM